MPIATLNNIEKTFGQRVLFDKLNLNVYRGERIGLIGANGSGKTSLFKVLVGQMIPDAGTASISKSISLGYLTQDPVFDPNNTVIDEAELAFAELHRLSHQMREQEHEMAHLTGDALEKILNQYQKTQHEFDLALERSGARRETTLHAGDFFHIDVVGARAAGLQACLIDSGDLYVEYECERVPSLVHLADRLLAAA